MIDLPAEGETLGEMLQRLREERGWTQSDVAARVDPDRADDMRAMKNLQTMLSRYENDKAERPDPVLLEKLERIYGLVPDALGLAALRTARQQQRRARITGDSIAIPAEPELAEAVRALFVYEPEEIVDITDFLQESRGLNTAERRQLIDMLRDMKAGRRYRSAERPEEPTG